MPPLPGLLGLDSYLTAWAVDSILSPPFDSAQGKFSRLAFSGHSTFKRHDPVITCHAALMESGRP